MSTSDDIHTPIGTSLQGVLWLSYAELVAELGEPSSGGSGDGKVQAEWGFDTPTGYVTCYDYKEDKPPSQVIAWHLGGHDTEVVVAWAESHGWKAETR
jgi:hypothetical protein